MEGGQDTLGAGVLGVILSEGLRIVEVENHVCC